MPWFARGSSSTAGRRSDLQPADTTTPEGTAGLLEKLTDTSDVWDVLWGLYTYRTPGAQDFLCNKLLSMDDLSIDMYLSQLCYLATVINSDALHKAVQVLCEKSLRIAVKVIWFLNAAVQDNYRAQTVDLRNRCERAGLLDGRWHPPFDDQQQMPLSPPRDVSEGSVMTPPTSPTLRAPPREMFSPRRGRTMDHLVSPEPFQSRGQGGDDILSPGSSSRPMSPEPSMHDFLVGTGVEGIILPYDVPRAPREDGIRRRLELLQKQLGKGEGVTALIEASSREPDGTLHAPLLDERRLSLAARPEHVRLTTFKITLDVVETLTGYSSKLAKYPKDVRKLRLARWLYRMNQVLAAGARKGSSCWFPLGTGNERIIRFVDDRAVILNSREKAPFLVYLEVLQASGNMDKEMEDLFSEGEDNQSELGDDLEGDSGFASDVEPEHSDAEGHTRTFSLEEENDPLDFPDTTGAGLPCATTASITGGSSQTSDSPILSDLSGPSPSGEGPVLKKQESLRLDGMSLRDDSASPSQGGTPGPCWRQVPLTQATANADQTGKKLANQQASERRGPHLLSRVLSPTRPCGDSSDSQRYKKDNEQLPRKLRAAASGLRGDGPVVAVELYVDDGMGAVLDDDSSGSETLPSMDRAGSSAGKEGLMRDLSKSQKEAVVQGSRLMHLLSSWSGYRMTDTKSAPEPYVRVKLKVYGGVDLTLPGTAERKTGHQRISSVDGLGHMEALLKEGTALASVAAKRQRHGSRAPLRDRNRAPSRSPKFGTPLDRRDAGREEGGARPCLQDTGNAHHHEPNSARARLHGSGQPSASGRGTMFASSLSNRGPHMVMSDAAMDMALKRQREAIAVFSPSFKEVTDEVQKESPFGHRPGWSLRQMIVKSGDDCRQEHMALQLIKVFRDIFQKADLPIWLRPFEVIVVNNQTALIEVVEDALSIHTIKNRGSYNSLAEFFFAKFIRGSQECREAQYRFTESMAGYSLVCYFLNIKDRHNGNLMLASDGRLLHIDFGFMLSNAPGGVSFETAPFKLTRELLEILDSDSGGRGSPMFDYFKVLFLQGFMACRASAEKIIEVVSIMVGSGFPCFRAGAATVDRLRQRFFLESSDTECVGLALHLISDSLDAFSSRQYDFYQKVCNGIC